ncbi:Protein unc-33 [Dirofilaria immitis]|nr:Protein unc-33 [Dirofilaria immitis]
MKNDINDSDGTISIRKVSQIVTKKSKPLTPVPPLAHSISSKSPDRTGSRSSTSASSNVSRSPRPRSKTSNTSLQSIRSILQDSSTITTTITTITTTTTTTTTAAAAAAAVSSKRLVRKGLDVSPAMLEFFGMKSITGPNACFQFIEERELPPSRKNKTSGEATKTITTDGDNVTNRSDEMAKNRHMKGYVRNLGEPGPEHMPGIESAKETSDDRYTSNETQIVISEEENMKMIELGGGMKSSKSREEMRRLAKNSLGYNYQQTNEPGPEYFNNAITNDENAVNKMEMNDEIVRQKNYINDGLQISAAAAAAVTVAATAVRAAAPMMTYHAASACTNAVCDIAKEGGGSIAEGSSMMVTTDATADAMKSSVEGVATALGTAVTATVASSSSPSSSTTTTTTTTMPITGISMDSGNGTGTFDIILIKGVQIINDDSIYMADVLIQDGVIRELSSKIEEPQGAHIIDGTDKALMPAGIEIYTDFSSSDSMNDFENGSKAALAGGNATIIDVIQPRSHETLLNAYDRSCKIAQLKSLCNVAFSVIISEWNDMIRKEMKTLVHDKGINSFIINIQRDEQLFEILEYCRSLRVHARIIPENKDIIALLEKRLRASGISGTECFHLSRPEASCHIPSTIRTLRSYLGVKLYIREHKLLEADMVNRISVLSKLTKCPTAVMSLSSPGAADVVLRQHNKMLIPEIPVTALEVKNDGKAIHLPLCICTSGHCEMRKKNSIMENFAPNVSAVEERMSILWVKGVLSGMIDPMRFVAITSSNAAKGRIAVGADADLVMWKLSLKHQASTLNQHSSLSKISTPQLKPVMTICGGRIAYNNGKFNLGRGKLVELESRSPYLYSMLEEIEGVQLNGGIAEGTAPHSNHFHLKENLSNSDTVCSIVEDTRGMRASTKVLNPPGGRSTGFW